MDLNALRHPSMVKEENAEKLRCYHWLLLMVIIWLIMVNSG